MLLAPHRNPRTTLLLTPLGLMRRRRLPQAQGRAAVLIDDLRPGYGS
jgi:hypothetical protein